MLVWTQYRVKKYNNVKKEKTIDVIFLINIIETVKDLQTQKQIGAEVSRETDKFSKMLGKTLGKKKFLIKLHSSVPKKF